MFADPVAALSAAVAIQRAAALHGAADHLYEQAGQAFDAVDLDLRASSHARLLGALGQAAFDAAGQLGRTLSEADAITLVVAVLLLALKHKDSISGRPAPAPAPVPDRASNFCATCGTRIITGDRFCQGCGAHMESQ